MKWNRQKQVEIEPEESELLVCNIPNEVLRGFKVNNFEDRIGASKEQFKNMLERLRSVLEKENAVVSPNEAMTLRNALAITLDELGIEEFQTRTGCDFQEGQTILQKLNTFVEPARDVDSRLEHGMRSDTRGNSKDNWVEVWFKIEKGADGYPESKTWEGLFTEKTDLGYMVKSVPFYLNNVSVGDIIEAVEEEFLTFRRVLARGGHNTYRLLLPEGSQETIDDIANELSNLGLGIEKEIGMLLAVDVPMEVNQEDIDTFLVQGKEDGRWQVQDGCLNGFDSISGT